MGKMETLTPCKIETLEQIDTHNVSGLISSTRGTSVPNLVKKIRLRGTSGQRGEI